MTDIEWVKAKCPVCGRDYQYPLNGYKPRTCNNFDCIHKFLHNRISELVVIYGEIGKGGDAQQTVENELETSNPTLD